MKLNNKGFAVTAILYMVLICFLLFITVTLLMFSSSNTIVNGATDDLVNNYEFSAKFVLVKITDPNSELSFDDSNDNNASDSSSEEPNAIEITDPKNGVSFYALDNSANNDYTDKCNENISNCRQFKNIKVIEVTNNSSKTYEITDGSETYTCTYKTDEKYCKKSSQ